MVSTYIYSYNFYFSVIKHKSMHIPFSGVEYHYYFGFSQAQNEVPRVVLIK